MMPKNLRAIEGEDVEGHGGRSLPRAIEGEDVEGHSAKLARRATEEDTEGHMMGNPLLNQQLARAREQDIQRNLRAHESRSDAGRPHKK
jgi:hypothetical protein